MLAAFINDDHDNWDEQLDALTFAYNTSVQSTTKHSPFELWYRRPKLPIDLIYDNLEFEIELSHKHYADNFKSMFKRAYDKIIHNRDVKVDKAKIKHENSSWWTQESDTYERNNTCN